jgi:hypothetical protein
MDRIEAAAFVRRTSMQGLLAPVLETFAESLDDDPAVQAAMRARQPIDERTPARVEQLDSRRP